MSVISKLRVWFGADTQDLEKGCKKAKKEVNNLNSGFSKLKGVIVGAFSIAAITSFIKKTRELAEIQWKAEKRLEGALKATGNQIGLTLDQLKDYASELQGKTLFGDETTLASMAKLAPFMNVTGDAFKRTIALAQDLAVIMDSDLNSAAVKLGKALNTPGVGLDELREAGIAFTQEQIAGLQELVAQGDIYTAQMRILDQVYKAVGGSAEEMAQKSEGAFAEVTQLGNAWGDYLETIGKGTGKYINPLISSLTKILKWVNRLTQDPKDAFTGPAQSQLELLDELQSKLQSMTDEQLADRLSDAYLWGDIEEYYPSNAIKLIKEEQEIRKSGIRDQEKAKEIEAARIKQLEMEKQKKQDILSMDENSFDAISAKQKAIDEVISRTSFLDSENLLLFENESARLKELKAYWEELASVIKSAGDARKNSSAIESISISGKISDKSKEELNKLASEIEKSWKVGYINDVRIPIEPVVDESEIIDWRSHFISLFSGLGDMLGNAIAGEFDVTDILTPIANIAAQLGSLLITVGTAILAFKTSLSSLNPFVAIAAGTALVAAAAAFKAFAGKSASGGGASGGGESAYSTQLSKYNEDSRLKVEGVLRADGDQLIAVIDNTNKRNRYTR